MSKFATASATPVLTLELDRTGSLAKKTMKLDQESQLTNSLLQGLYPGIRVATVDVPTEPLDSCEQAIVEQALTRIEVDDIRYSLVEPAAAPRTASSTLSIVPSKRGWGSVFASRRRPRSLTSASWCPRAK